MKKVAIFENEINLFKPIFDVTNTLKFQNLFDFSFFPKSQDIGAIENINNYDLIIIDIELAPKSELDGYGLIKKILEINSKSKIVILTGHSRVKDSISEYGFNKEFPIIQKPIQLSNLEEVLRSFSF